MACRHLEAHWLSAFAFLPAIQIRVLGYGLLKFLGLWLEKIRLWLEKIRLWLPRFLDPAFPTHS